MKPQVKELILHILEDHQPIHPYGIYRVIKDEYRRDVAYGTVRWNLLFLRGEGRVRRLSREQAENLGLQIQPNRNGRSGYRLTIKRTYCRVTG